MSCELWVVPTIPRDGLHRLYTACRGIVGVAQRQEAVELEQVDLLLLRNTDDFPALPSEPGTSLAENRRCHPRWAVGCELWVVPTIPRDGLHRLYTACRGIVGVAQRQEAVELEQVDLLLLRNTDDFPAT